MIDEKKLIEEIKNRRDFWLSKASKYDEIKDEMNTDICDGKAVELGIVMKMIQELPKIDKWIPTKVPPKNDEKVLVTYQKSNGHELLIGFDRYKRYPEHGFERWEGKGRRIKAWSPLPEPWGGEEK